MTRNIEEYADSSHERYQWWPSITHEWKSHSGERYDIEIDADIYENLHQYKSSYASSEILAEGIFHEASYRKSTVGDREVSKEKKQCSEKPKLFDDHWEHKIPLYFWKVSEFLYRLSESETKKPTTSECDKPLLDLIILIIYCFFGEQGFIFLKKIRAASLNRIF